MLEGQAGDDSLSGGDGNDTYVFAGGDLLGSDTITESSGGGTGNDTLDFSDLQSGITGLDLGLTATAQVVSSGVLKLTLTNATVENVTGSPFDDNITGNSLDNSLSGGIGDDHLVGGDGNDSLVGGLGNDTLEGGAGTMRWWGDRETTPTSSLRLARRFRSESTPWLNCQTRAPIRSIFREWQTPPACPLILELGTHTVLSRI